MVIAQYLSCNLIGIYICCMSFGRGNAGYNVIHQSFESTALQRVLAHVLYLFPLGYSVVFLFPYFTRDSSLFAGVLELDHEAVHTVEEDEHQLLETRSRLIRAIYKYALSKEGQRLMPPAPDQPVSSAANEEEEEEEDAAEGAGENKGEQVELMPSSSSSSSSAAHAIAGGGGGAALQHHIGGEVQIDDWHSKEDVILRIFHAWSKEDHLAMATAPCNCLPCGCSGGGPDAAAGAGGTQGQQQGINRKVSFREEGEVLSISRVLFEKHLKAINFHASRHVIHKLLRALDPDRSNWISMSEWCEFFSKTERELQVQHFHKRQAKHFEKVKGAVATVVSSPRHRP